MKTTRAAALLLAALTILAVLPPRASAMGSEPILEVLIEPHFQTDTLYGFIEGAAITYSDGIGYELVGLDGKPLTERAYDLIRACSSGLYVVSLGGKYGALNLRGKVMLPFSYDLLSDFMDGYAVSVRNGISQIINLAGNIGSPLDYDEFELLSGGLVRFARGGLWGLATVHGEVLARPVYDEIGDFSDDNAVVKRYGLFGAIDTSGKEIVRANYEVIEPFGDGVAIAKINERFGLIGKDGKQLTPTKYVSMSRYEGMFKAETSNGEYFLIGLDGAEHPMPYEPDRPFFESLWVVRGGDFHDSLYGIVNLSGEILLPVEYDIISDIDALRGNFADVSKNGAWGLIDSNADIISSTGYDRLSVCSSSGEIVAIQGGGSTVFDLTGKVILSLDAGFASFLSDGMRAVRGLNGVWGYLDKNGEVAIPFKYSDATDFFNGFAAVKDGDTAYIIDKSGKIVSSNPVFPHINLGNGIFAVFGGDSAPFVGVIDKTGKLILPYEFSDIDAFDYNQDFYRISRDSGKDKNSLYGLIDCFGRLALPAEYERIISADACSEAIGQILFPSGLYWVLKDGKWGLIRLTIRADIPTDWAREHVERAITAGIVPEGFSKNYSVPATRAEFCGLAVALYERIKGAEIPVRVKFTDTKDVNVEKMAGLNVVAGTGGNKFSPDNPITREQAAVILSKLAGELGVKKASSGAEDFADMDLVSEWARDAVFSVRSLGVMSGVGSGKFGPKGNYTREQCITTLLKVYDLVKK